MNKATNEDFKELEDKLKFIGLDLENLPEFITNFKPIQYKPARYTNENAYQVYKYINVEDIEILLTPTNRLNSIQEKYADASTLYSYLNPKDDEGILKHTTFLKMLKDFSVDEVKNIEKEQKELSKAVPYKVKFKDNYLWQIYYSAECQKYFMLVTTKDLDYSGFFYLLKKKIEVESTKRTQKIYVPVSHMEYSGAYLKRSEFADIEKYLWLFTKEWPLTYEVYDKLNKLSIQIIGETNVYEKIKSFYRIKLSSKEEANEFYKLVKALFILQTELPHYYNFNTRINQYGNLEFEYEGKKLKYDDLADLLKRETIKNMEQTKELEKERVELKAKLQNLKQISTSQDEEYIQKEKQIAMYLECRKSFFGKVKYFIQARKGKKLNKVQLEKKQMNIEAVEEPQIEFIQKEHYTIEDLVKICKQLDEVLVEVKKLKLDIKASENRIENMRIKIENATLYIEEIDSHEKSIFEFWKFANKDEQLMLVQGEEESVEPAKKISKIFDYEEDMEELGIQIDKTARSIFSKEETDAIFVMGTVQREVINNIDSNKALQEGLEMVKTTAEEEKVLFRKENFDIFGGIAEDSTKIKLIGSKKHREVAKDIVQILDITKNTDIEEYKTTLEKQEINFKKALAKSVAPMDMSVFIEKEQICDEIEKAYINPEIAINNAVEDKIYLHKINLREGSNVVYLSNIIFYENNNRTLPLGMDLSNCVLIDLTNTNLDKIKETSFRVVEEKEENKIEIKQVVVVDYEINKKDEGESYDK